MIDARFCCSNLSQTSSGFKFEFATTLALQANQLTKYPSHPGYFSETITYTSMERRNLSNSKI